MPPPLPESVEAVPLAPLPPSSSRLRRVDRFVPKSEERLTPDEVLEIAFVDIIFFLLPMACLTGVGGAALILRTGGKFR